MAVKSEKAAEAIRQPKKTAHPQKVCEHGDTGEAPAGVRVTISKQLIDLQKELGEIGGSRLRERIALFSGQ